MTAPETPRADWSVPDAALAAAAHELSYPMPTDARHFNRAARVFAAAAPHIVAATLRQAADRIMAGPDAGRWHNIEYAELLRHWADEVQP